MASYDELKDQQTDLIRKSLGGSLFIADISADVLPDDPFVYTAEDAGPPVVPATIDFDETDFEDYLDLGYLTDDGIAFENETSQSDITSWQSVQPTRSDITSDIDSLTVVAQETKLASLQLFTGAILSPASVPNPATTGTLSIAKPERPSARFYRGFAIAVDGEGDQEIFIGRIYPRLKVTGKNGQSYQGGDNALSWGVTMTAFHDSTVGYSCRYVFGGLGWKARLGAMGFLAP